MLTAIIRIAWAQGEVDQINLQSVNFVLIFCCSREMNVFIYHKMKEKMSMLFTFPIKSYYRYL